MIAALPAQQQHDHDENQRAAVEQHLADPPSPRIVRLEDSVDEHAHDAHHGEQHDHRDNADEQRAGIGRLGHVAPISTTPAGMAQERRALLAEIDEIDRALISCRDNEVGKLRGRKDRREQRVERLRWVAQIEREDTRRIAERATRRVPWSRLPI